MPDYWDDGETTWDKALPKWKEVYEESLLSLVSDEVAETVKKIVDIYASDKGRLIQEELIKELQNNLNDDFLESRVSRYDKLGIFREG